ncbi:hypothetical protein [Arthrobacter sp. 18067]|uniref:hypothetical protein n=1 Tax=Arthrobacter sp. 18067 TaxID=2681413 RepID=UPI00135CDB5D|nr:hypothetical protein [Arthrobacter sp. 18067]
MDTLSISSMLVAGGRGGDLQVMEWLLPPSGPNLYSAAASTPGLVAARIPKEE